MSCLSETDLSPCAPAESRKRAEYSDRQERQKGKDMIRKAVFQDEDQIAVVYEKARAYMAEHGNPNQWGRTFPPRELTHEDIEKGILYVLEEQGEVHGAFMFEIGEDPTYHVISEGAWKSDAPYGVIHRVASDGKVHGLMKETIAFCSSQISHLRMDTHEKNLTMQHQLLRNGFEYCGVILTHDHTPRLAYEKL